MVVAVVVQHSDQTADIFIPSSPVGNLPRAMLDRTVEFRQYVEENKRSLPEGKRRKISRPPRRPLADREGEQKALLSTKDYAAEAYTILNHVTTISRMLNSIRRPYLNVDSGSSFLSRQPSRNLDLGGSDEGWSSIRHLTNEERDQIDLQARVILSRCADRVKEMETLEKRRAEIAANKSNPILRLLPSRLLQDAASVSSDFVAAHHSGITWFLNRRLAEASKNQKEMQEERIKRQMERATTLGSGAAKEAIDLGTRDLLALKPEKVQSQANNGSWLGGIGGPSGLASSLASSFTGSNSSYVSQSTIHPSGHRPVPDDDSNISDDDAEELELTSSQILQFETENANILRSVQDTLASVQMAESRLLDISALQMELVAHLTRQTEITEQLHEDAIATSAMVDKGNAQLREARRRAKDSRLFILLFLFGASLALLFIHFY
ncbi:snare protein syntaxin 18/UFE1 [Ramaria rubella]|nr:snare protein syntaxin 18/UFE1 [Ramaria rubella]